MLTWTASVRQFILNDDGPTTVEYGVMLALIVIACATVVTSLGRSMSSKFSQVSTFGS